MHTATTTTVATSATILTTTIIEAKSWKVKLSGNIEEEVELN